VVRIWLDIVMQKEDLLRKSKMGKTMHEEYGDGSDHECCDLCGFCLTCGDCDKFGCGDPTKI